MKRVKRRTRQVRGVSLVSGRTVRVQFEARDGPLTIGCPAWAAVAPNGALTRDAWHAFARGHTTHLAHGDIAVATVEHLASALAGLGLHAGLHVELVDNEVPFLDGAAATFVRVLGELGVPPSAPSLRVLKAGTVIVGTSIYTFARGDCVYIACELVSVHPLLVRDAVWDGTPDDYVQRIAPARTFLFEEDATQYLRDGVRAHVDPASIVIVGAGLHAQNTVDPAEPARHKLLDLLGDLYLHGGPPLGRISARAPGHAATHVAMREAIARGIVGVIHPPL
jgi:UDP-3-O-[3-hydroxymyristoyl] N-acetylglucosamine deacetylase